MYLVGEESTNEKTCKNDILSRKQTGLQHNQDDAKKDLLQHGISTLLHLLGGGDTRGVDIKDTRSDLGVVAVSREGAEDTHVTLGVLDGQDIGIHADNGLEDILEVRVAHVGVDDGGILDTGGREQEGIDGPLEVKVKVDRAEGKTLTNGGLIDLDVDNASLLQVGDLIADGQGQLGADDGAGDVITDEGPLQAGDGTGQHTLHGLAGQGLGVDGLGDGHGVDTMDISKDNWGTDAAGTVRGDPSVLREDVALETLTKVGDHVVTLSLTVDEDVDLELLLFLDTEGNLLLDEVMVGSSIDLALGELSTGKTDLLGLGEGADGGGGEGRERVSFVLLDLASGEDVAATELVGDDGLETLANGSVGGVGRDATGLNGAGIVGQLSLDRVGTVVQGMGDDVNFLALLLRVGEPVKELGVLGGEALLEAEGDGGVQERARGSDEDTVRAEGSNGGLSKLEGGCQVGLPDVTTIDQTEGKDLGLADVGNNVLELLGGADEIDVKTSNTRVLDEGDVVADASKVGGDQELELGGSGGQAGIGGVEVGNDGSRNIEGEDGLVDLDPVGTGSSELGKELLIDGEDLGEEGDEVEASRVLGSLSEEEEGEGTEDDGASVDAEGLGLVELLDGLDVGAEVEGLVCLELRDTVIMNQIRQVDVSKRLLCVLQLCEKIMHIEK